MNIVEVEGIGPVYAEKLKAAGVAQTDDLLQAGATPQGRKSLAQKSGIDEQMILQWVNHCDLMRIKGVGSEYADLLEAAGVDTVKELAQRRPDNLLAKVLEVNESKKLVRRTPTASMVESWVTEAKSLPGAISY
ncbi:MAG: DUF4332 domain-containing protein [Dehalococcoidia bacterium]|nr:MAG: DUF4332 domain-containing protein [bacterium]MCE7927862.1 DUF4332 domain-containing protein [Chloroflexi bacterium CFX7]MCK6564604.1 DUF4332 domain-containing protein [Dehalococcoidia bacterium]MCL4229961.1 DUF4332 domain-containing protein [Dehalococcoidia bacterium]NUQ55589.1 DUF4332 domain-containing protein [Dehalococcoidia bacterium]